jgi:DNA-binding NarL/FixJ family response regulator
LLAPLVRDPGTRDAVRVAVIDNHEATRDGLQFRLIQSADLLPVGAFADVESFLASGRDADVVVLDLNLGRDDRTAIPQIGQLLEKGSQVLIYTAEEAPVPLRNAVAAGAGGVCLKNDGVAALIAAIHQVAAGELVFGSAVATALVTDPKLVAHLTRREIELLTLLDDGLDLRQIAKRWGVSDQAPKEHLANIRTKYCMLGEPLPKVLGHARAEGRIPATPLRPRLPGS